MHQLSDIYAVEVADPLNQQTKAVRPRLLDKIGKVFAGPAASYNIGMKISWRKQKNQTRRSFPVPRRPEPGGRTMSQYMVPWGS